MITNCKKQMSGGRVSLDGMPPSALLEGGARDEVVGGMKSELGSDGTKPNLPYHNCTRCFRECACSADRSVRRRRGPVLPDGQDEQC